MWMEELTLAGGSKEYIGSAFRSVPGGGTACCPAWERKRAADRIADLQRTIGSQASVQIVAGPTKESLLEAMRGFDADVLIIGGRPQSSVNGGLRDLTYALVRDSPPPVLSVLRQPLASDVAFPF